MQKYSEPLPDIIFMCVGKDQLLNLCELFPQTAENIKRKSLERRQKFIQQKNMNSKRFWQNYRRKNQLADSDDDLPSDFGPDHYIEGLEEFHTDEEAD
mmetsp:Transcript_30350/g.46449  ORF Transcript_30350/g.46449 Transcript_30350/m.46449 type:complete len:98 (+) Transcript_30350:2248-2541(+)